VKDQHGKLVAVMSNPLLRRKLTLDVMQQHVLHLAIGQIEDPRDENADLPMFRISASAYAEATGRSVRAGSLYRELAEAVRGLQHVEVALPGGVRIAILAPYAEYIKDEARIEVEFNPRLKPYVLGIREYFAQVPIDRVCKLRSGYAIAFYLYCLSWQHARVRGWEMTIDELRRWLCIPPGTLQRVCDLTKRVIYQAQKELDQKSTISFRPKPIREGRGTTGWFFEVVDNQLKAKRKPKRRSAPPLAEPLPKPDLEPIARMWAEAGAAQRQAWLADEFLRRYAPKDDEPPRPLFLARLQELTQPTEAAA
jgi:hypothetical protein